jgi:DNA-binding NtrC family response regulator
MSTNAAKILVVDDDANIRATVRMCLETDGYTVIHANDGAIALDKIRRESPDLVLLDLAMPRMDGIALLQAFGREWRLPPARVIVMTAHGSVRTAVQAIRLGASDYLEKPFTPDDLRLSVASVLSEDRAGETGLTAGATYDAVLTGVRDALVDGHVPTAESLLNTAAAIADADPVFLNLAGAIHEAHGRITGARKLYRRAAAAPGGYAPARRNMARLDAAEKSGQPAAPADLGQPAVQQHHQPSREA